MQLKHIAAVATYWIKQNKDERRRRDESNVLRFLHAHTLIKQLTSWGQLAQYSSSHQNFFHPEDVPLLPCYCVHATHVMSYVLCYFALTHDMYIRCVSLAKLHFIILYNLAYVWWQYSWTELKNLSCCWFSRTNLYLESNWNKMCFTMARCTSLIVLIHAVRCTKHIGFYQED